MQRATLLVKRHLTKLTQELQSSCTQLLPLAPLKLRISPCLDSHLSLFQLLYGRPFLSTDLLPDPEFNALATYVSSLGQALKEIRSYANTLLPAPESSLMGSKHPKVNPGHWVFLKLLPNSINLFHPPGWAHQVLLTMLMSVKPLDTLREYTCISDKACS